MKKLLQGSELALWISSSHYSGRSFYFAFNDFEKATKIGEKSDSRCHPFLTLACVCVCASVKGTSTLGLALGFSCSNFLAAASMDVAAPRSSVSAITVGSWGSTHSDPEVGRSRAFLHHCCYKNNPVDLVINVTLSSHLAFML